jgi:hypothetical protein
MVRFHLGVWNSDLTKEEWAATNIPIRGQFLVALDLGMGGEDPNVAKSYEAALRELSKGARGRQDISQYVWLFEKDEQLERMFQTLVDHLGPNHHNFTVVEFSTGTGLGYNAKRRVVYEINT